MGIKTNLDEIARKKREAEERKRKIIEMQIRSMSLKEKLKLIMDSESPFGTNKEIGKFVNDFVEKHMKQLVDYCRLFRLFDTMEIGGVKEE